MKKDIASLSLILILVALASAQENIPHKGGVSGVVRYPDGSPSSGATVTASTACPATSTADPPGTAVNITRIKWVKTGRDGSFYVPPFLSSHCNRILLRAEKPGDFWLRTGREVFYESDNGTTPEVDAPRTGEPIKTEIMFGKKGGLVSFRVRDITSDRFIWAELRLEHVPALEFPFNFLGVNTDSSAVLLPAGQYNVFLENYSCHGKNYFTDGVPLESLTVEATEKVTKDFSVDLRVIKPTSSAQNPKGEPCEP